MLGEVHPLNVTQVSLRCDCIPEAWVMYAFQKKDLIAAISPAITLMNFVGMFYKVSYGLLCYTHPIDVTL